MTRAVYVLHRFMDVYVLQWCRPVQMTRAVYVLHGLNGAVLNVYVLHVPVLYKQQELYMYYMIQWRRPVQTTRAVYVLHRLNGAVLYKQQEQYMYCMD